eukprot:11150613-Alexandrium_andersonii.AAC.1
MGDWGGHPSAKCEQVSNACAHMPWCVGGVKRYPIGEALNPGPAEVKAEDVCVLQTLNITSCP